MILKLYKPVEKQGVNRHYNTGAIGTVSILARRE